MSPVLQHESAAGIVGRIVGRGGEIANAAAGRGAFANGGQRLPVPYSPSPERAFGAFFPRRARETGGEALGQNLDMHPASWAPPSIAVHWRQPARGPTPARNSPARDTELRFPRRNTPASPS